MLSLTNSKPIFRWNSAAFTISFKSPYIVLKQFNEIFALFTIKYFAKVSSDFDICTLATLIQVESMSQTRSETVYNVEILENLP